eukprot:743792-Pleurochrysis_carterae.AAC.1
MKLESVRSSKRAAVLQPPRGRGLFVRNLTESMSLWNLLTRYMQPRRMLNDRVIGLTLLPQWVAP